MGTNGYGAISKKKALFMRAFGIKVRPALTISTRLFNWILMSRRG